MTDEPNKPIDELAPVGEAETDSDSAAPEKLATPADAPQQDAALDVPDSQADEVEETPADVAEVAEAEGEPEAASEPEAVEDQSAEDEAVEDEAAKMDWYILKVQSNRENSIAEALQRRVAIAGMEEFFGEIIVPSEKVTEFKGGKKRVVKRKLYPGYIVAHMAINDDTWFLVRETPGIGDFTGAAGKPTAMLPHEVARIVQKSEEKTDEAPKLKINFSVSDRVKINEGTFDNFEGEVSSIDEASGRITVMINIFGRSTPVELEYWQVETL